MERAGRRDENEGCRNEKTASGAVSSFIHNLAMTYSHTIVRCTTIGVTAFHFCVRNGDRWDYSTMVARKTGGLYCNLDISISGGTDGNRTRDLLRDRQAF